MFSSNTDNDRFQASLRQGQGPYVPGRQEPTLPVVQTSSQRELIPMTGHLLPQALGPRP